MSNKIEDVEGIGPAFAEKLNAQGIKNTDEMLDRCASPKGRKALAEATGISDKLILKWANHCDLMRINGVGGEFAELLEAAGVDTVKELRNRKPENLAAKMKETNEAKSLTRVTPSAKMVTDWVEQAKGMEPKLTY